MPANYLTKTVSKKKTPQSEPIPGSGQVQNNAGGYAWDVGDEKRLEQFLILGSEGGTYYVGEKQLTKQNTQTIQRLIKAEGEKVVQKIVEISDGGRAPRNEPALYALALCMSDGIVPYKKELSPTHRAAFNAIPKVARNGTHLFTLYRFVEEMRGLGGHALAKAFANWFFSKTPEQLAYQVVKYKSRTIAGRTVSMKDILRTAHVNPDKETMSKEDRDQYKAIFSYVVEAESERKGRHPLGPALEDVKGAEYIKHHLEAMKAEDEKTIVKMITDYRLVREAIPTQFLKSPKVQEALLQHMLPEAMIRNLGSMTASGLVAPLSNSTKFIVDKLRSTTRDGTPLLKKMRVHPIKVLIAMMAYKTGHNRPKMDKKGRVIGSPSMNWKPVAQIEDALEDAFYATFDYVEPTGKKFYLAVDVSSSMTVGMIAGVQGLTPNMGAAAMAMLTARTESQYIIRGFCSDMRDLGITAKDKLQAAMRKTQAHWGSTDAAIPMRDALSSRLDVDAFVVYSDMQTWAGQEHPAQALRNYRDRMSKPDARLICCGMTSEGFTIADPKDAGSLNIVGFDTAVPTLIADFVTDGGTSDPQWTDQEE